MDSGGMHAQLKIRVIDPFRLVCLFYGLVILYTISPMKRRNDSFSTNCL